MDKLEELEQRIAVLERQVKEMQALLPKTTHYPPGAAHPASKPAGD